MQTRHIRRFCKLDEKGDGLLEQVTDKLSRTIADLAGVEQIEILHLSEAIQYRGQDRKKI